jgi:hypothetical protein
MARSVGKEARALLRPANAIFPPRPLTWGHLMPVAEIRIGPGFNRIVLR